MEFPKTLSAEEVAKPLRHIRRRVERLLAEKRSVFFVYLGAISFDFFANDLPQFRSVGLVENEVVGGVSRSNHALDLLKGTEHIGVKICSKGLPPRDFLTAVDAATVSGTDRPEMLRRH